MPDTTGFKRDVVGSYIEKDPGATLTYTVNWADWLTTGVNLSTIDFTVSAPASGDTTPLTASSPVIVDNNKATIILSAGKHDETYTVTNTITTDNGDTDVRRFRVVVQRRHL